ncbi:MAG: TIGR03643 family protein [Verrucomicrobiales bacterium]|nr:TIGR03643 family protein [Verrucomicrobiales bacterium]
MRTDPQTNRIIRLAWEDRTTFEEIEERTGLTEGEVIRVMRRELKPSSFRMWRKRVSGRITKHRKRFEKEVRNRRRWDEE